MIGLYFRGRGAGCKCCNCDRVRSVVSDGKVLEVSGDGGWGCVCSSFWGGTWLIGCSGF